MYLHHIKLAFRSLWRNRLYAFLNLAGLAIGMAATMLVVLWVQNELRFDAYHSRAAQLWRIKTDIKINDSETWNWGSTPLKIKELCDQTPGIAATVQMMIPFGQKAILHRGVNLFEEEKFAYVEPAWFSLFDYEFVEGSAAGFGENPNGILLTESLARKIFGIRSALGATLRMDSAEYMVHAVLRDPRPESSFRQNLLIPLEAWLNLGDNRTNDNNWNNFNYNTFVELLPNASPENIGRQLTSQLVAAKADSNVVLHLGALTDLHFDQSIKGDAFDKGNRRTVATFGAIGLLILLMAAINYVSLTTARAQTRAREAGVRKMIGAGRWQLFWQFLSESALLSAGAAGLALALVQTTLPWFSELAGRIFILPWESPLLWLLTAGTLVGTILLAGIYPAILMAGFQPLKTLRGSGKAGAYRSVFRQSLVVAQFSITVALLICTIVIGQQRTYIQNKEIGYDRAHIFTFSIGWRQFHTLGAERGQKLLETFKQTLSQSAAVAGVSCANDSPVHIKNTHSGSVKFDGLPEDAVPTISQLNADEDFAKLFGIKIAEGRWFNPDLKTDENHVILNETAARKLGLPQPWLGQRFGLHGREGQVIGVIRDFHFLPMHEAIMPLVIFNAPGWRGNFFVKTQPGQSKAALAAAETVWKQWFPDSPFAYSFLDEDFNQLYRTEQQTSVLFNLFAGITILIACLGLFGLATFVATQRTKEIGIRKVLGASVAGISGLLTKDFLKLVGIAIFLATPVAYYAMQQWLADFAYRIELEWWMFALAGVVAVVIAFFTVSVQSVRAALANPVKSLRSE